MPHLLTFLLFAFSIVQPVQVSVYAPNIDGVVRQHYGFDPNLVPSSNVALIASEYKAGQSFKSLGVGDNVNVVYDDHIKTYKVAMLLHFQVTSGYEFVPDGGGRLMTELELFNSVYAVPDGRLVLQTCYDNANGRLFIVAYPVQPRNKPE